MVGHFYRGDESATVAKSLRNCRKGRRIQRGAKEVKMLLLMVSAM